MRADHKIFLCRMHNEIVNRCEWEVATEATPCSACIEADVESALSASIEKPLAERIFAYNPHKGTLRNALCRKRPRCTVVSRGVDVRRVIAVLVAIDRCVGCAGAVW